MRFVPVADQVIGGFSTGTATKGIGDSAIAFFIDQSSMAAVKQKLGL